MFLCFSNEFCWHTNSLFLREICADQIICGVCGEFFLFNLLVGSRSNENGRIGFPLIRNLWCGA